MAYRRWMLSAFWLSTFSKIWTGSIPEKDPQDDKLYNTCTVYNPQGMPGVLSDGVGLVQPFCAQGTWLRCIARFTYSTLIFLERLPLK